ncbi:MAG TPA: cytochrome P450 [Acidimicrobiales bacterium]|nr:cytochrome P450 [Acidimicrobiales bacterium]
MTHTAPVTDWATDFDVMDPGYLKDPFTIWDQLRQSCPIPHTDRRKSSWMPLRYDDVTAIAHDIEHFSSLKVAVIPADEDEDPNENWDGPSLEYGLPPISADPPLHTWTRRLLLPWFSHKRVDSYVPLTRELCRSLLDGFADKGHADAAADYAQQIPVRVIARILGVSTDMADTFTEWVRDVLEFADDQERRQAGVEGLLYYFVDQLAQRKEHPGDDLLSELLHTEVEGKQVDDGIVLGMAALVLIAGVDTTWSGIGSALWHLASHEEDRKRLVAEPDLMPTAVEELLRAYSPVTMAREVTQDVEYAGCPMKAGDKVLMNFPAANRDPEAFENPDVVQLDRAHNRHVAFGSGIHRCAGSNLARMELQVALEEWLTRIPEFTLAEGEEITWAGGQVRGPRILPVVFP